MKKPRLTIATKTHSSELSDEMFRIWSSIAADAHAGMEAEGLEEAEWLAESLLTVAREHMDKSLHEEYDALLGHQRYNLALETVTS